MASVLASVVVIVLTGLSLWTFYQDYRDAVTRERFAATVVTAAFQLTSLTGDYMLYRQPRARDQWMARHESLGELLRETGFHNAGDDQEIFLFGRNHATAQRLFEHLANSFTESFNNPKKVEAAVIREKRLFDTLLTVTQAMVSEASLLATRSRLSLDVASERIMWSIASLILIFAAMVVLLTFILARRVVTPLQTLTREIDVLGAGNLEYRLQSSRGDEIGEVATAFNEMAGRLQETLVSRDEMAKEVTERKRAESDLRQAKEEAELANRTKSRFLASMSHELRTPLNAIIGFSDMILSGIHGPIGNSKYEEYQTDINYSGKHLLALINDVLDISRVESGQEIIHEEKVDIVSAIDTVGRLVSDKAKEGCVSIKTQIDGNLPLLWADDLRVKQILLNLMANAVKFTSEGGKVTVKAGVNHDGAIVLTVMDTGIGIAPDDIPNVMEPFQQADNTLSRKHEGTGLGLPLAKSFVELHGGSLDLKSQVGIGTTVTVTFPVDRSMHVALGRQPQLN